jgi:biopolymer transport protein ExbD/biopolymer transport protein TolR
MRSLFSDSDSPGRKDEAELGMDITPMIDMTFLLLIFFMVTSTMQVEARLQMPAATHGAGVPLENAVVISIFKTGDEPQIVAGADPDKPTLLATEVGGYVAEGIKSGKTTIIIKADRDIPSGFVEEVARSANEVAPEGVELSFYVGVQDKPKR